jgi:hypothetical protein
MSIAMYTACKSHVSVNHLHLHVQFFYIYTYPIVMYILFLQLHEANLNICQIQFTWPMRMFWGM